MTHDPTGPRPLDPPAIPAPPPFRERRVSLRRAADRALHRETVLLARSLDLLAAEGDARGRLAAVLGLLAATVGARRAAVVAGGVGGGSDTAARRVVVLAREGEPPDEAERLGAWLDATAPRPRPERAAAPPAPIAVVTSPAGPTPRPAATNADGRRGAGPSELHFRCLPVREAGDVAFGFAFGRRVTEEELAERLPPRLARHAAVVLSLVTRELAVEGELAELRAREAERAHFVSTVAHELRTPLTGLTGYLDLLVGGQVGDREVEREFLERAASIVASMDDLVGDLLELSRLQSGRLRIDVGPFSLTEACEHAADVVAPVAARAGIAVRTVLPQRLASATGDARRVEQIVTNLLGNAVKFSPAGSTVEVVGRVSGTVAFVVVRDEGPGIAADDRRRIFERFYRLAVHERVPGTGLGLPIARELARAMGGDLAVASVEGSGSSFVLALPGPTGAEPEAIAAALEAELTAEEQRLEEAAVLRALRIAGRSLPRPRLVPPPADGSHGAPEVAGDERVVAPIRPVRLRAIDGLASLDTTSQGAAEREQPSREQPSRDPTMRDPAAHGSPHVELSPREPDPARA